METEVARQRFHMKTLRILILVLCSLNMLVVTAALDEVGCKALSSTNFAVDKDNVTLHERRKYADRLRIAIDKARADPNNAILQMQIAAYSAALGNWSTANKAFLRGSNYACFVAARAEQGCLPPVKIADAWWTASSSKPDFLPRILKAHAVKFYKKALENPYVMGTQKEEAESRIAEFEADTERELYWRLPLEGEEILKVGNAQFVGAALVGESVWAHKGIIRGFGNASYVKMLAPFKPGGETFEVVMEFTVAGRMIDAGLMGCIGQEKGFSPFHILNNRLYGCLSSNGRYWDIACNPLCDGVLKINKTYRVRCTYDGETYAWFLWDRDWNLWSLVKKEKSNKHVLCDSDIQIGTICGKKGPFIGSVDMNKCYICIGGKLWWEGIKGAYQNANR